MNKKKVINQNLFFTVSALNEFGGSLTKIVLLTIATVEHGSKGAISILVVFYIAIPFGGFLVAYLNKYIDGIKAIISSEIVRAISILPLILLQNSNLLLLCIAQFLISLLETIYHPNRYFFISSIFDDQKQKARFIAHIQIFDSIAGVCAPMVSGLIILFFSFQICLIIDVISYLVSTIYWIQLRYSYEPKPLENISLSAGYVTLINNTQVRNINIARILANALFIFWNVFLPIAIINGIARELSSLAYAISAAFMATGIAIGGYGTSKYIQYTQSRNLQIIVYLAAASIILASLFMLPFIHDTSIGFVGIAVISSILGVAIAGARTACIVVGQQVTPALILHLVIAAGDSIVRIISALIALILGVIVSNYSNGNVILFVVLAIVCSASLSGFVILTKVETKHLRNESPS